MRRCVRAAYGDLIFLRDVGGDFVSADRIGGRCVRRVFLLFAAVILGLCSLSRQSIHRF